MNKTYYYVSGNTAKGYVNYIESNMKNMRNIFLVKHPANHVLTALMKQIIDELPKQADIEIINSTSGDYIAGLILREMSLAVITEEINDPSIKPTEIINVEDRLHLLKNGKESNIPTETKKEKYKDEAYALLAEGLRIHDDLEDVFINEMDFQKADNLAETFIEELLGDVSQKEKESTIYLRLFGTNTRHGAVNIIPSLIEPINNRYFIKGRAGTGKSVFMKRIITACELMGLDMEVYRCSFDPESIDMIIIRSLDFCIFDSTDPHEFAPEREHDKVIDLYEEAVTAGTDEKYANEIKEITTHYKSFMKKGLKQLKQAAIEQDKIEEKYMVPSPNVMEDVIQDIIP